MIAPLQNIDCLFLAKENPAKVGYATLAVVESATLIDTAKAFLAAHYHLEDVSGMMVAEGAVSAYHFSHFDNNDRATVLVVAPLDNAVFPSIAAVYQGAEWHERETRDFFGFQYEGNPNFIPLLLAETMPDVHPLQKAENDLAPLSAIFSAEGREREIVKKAENFTLLDVPVKEVPPPAPEEAPAPAPVEAPKAEAEKTPEPVVAPSPETTKTEEIAKNAPVAETKEEPVIATPEKTPEPVAETKPEPTVEPEATPEPAPKPEDAKVEPVTEAAPKPAAPPAPKTALKADPQKAPSKKGKSSKKGAGK